MLNNLLIHSVQIQVPTPTKGTSGGEIVSWSTSETIPCRVDDASSFLKNLYFQRNILISHTVYANQSHTIKAGYQLLWGSRVLRVVGVMDSGGAGRVLRIDCQEITQ